MLWPDRPTRPFLGLLAVACTTLAAWSWLSAAQEALAPRTAPRLVVDYGDGVEKHFTQLDFNPGGTVLDLLIQADKHPRGLDVKYRGRGETAFVVAIDGLAGEGAGRDSRNWMFFVNDKPADRSCGIMQIEENDHVVWKFAAFRPR